MVGATRGAARAGHIVPEYAHRHDETDDKQRGDDAVADGEEGQQEAAATLGTAIPAQGQHDCRKNTNGEVVACTCARSKGIASRWVREKGPVDEARRSPVTNCRMTDTSASSDMSDATRMTARVYLALLASWNGMPHAMCVPAAVGYMMLLWVAASSTECARVLVCVCEPAWKHELNVTPRGR